MTGKGGSRTAPTGRREWSGTTREGEERSRDVPAGEGEVDSRSCRHGGQALRGNNGWGGNDVGAGVGIASVGDAESPGGR